MKNKLVKTITIIGCLTAFSLTLNAQEGKSTDNESKLIDSIVRLEAYRYIIDKSTKDSKTSLNEQFANALKESKDAIESVKNELSKSKIAQTKKASFLRLLNQPQQADQIKGQMGNAKTMDQVKWNQKEGEKPIVVDIKKLKEKIISDIQKEEQASASQTNLGLTN